MSITAVVADDSTLIREGISRLLADESITVLGQAADGRELLELVIRHRPDIAIVDIRMPPGFRIEGIQAATAIHNAVPSTGVLLLSQYLETENAIDVLRTAVSGVGYLLKPGVGNLEDFIDAVRRVAAGETVLDPTMISEVLNRPRLSRQPIDNLTDREREVLRLMAEGYTNLGIKNRLFLSERTIEAYIGTIFAKLGLAQDTEAHRRVLAVLTYLRALPDQTD